jgi:tetratricopeptide (TPR) repeat protein
LGGDRGASEDAYALLVARFPDDPEYRAALAHVKHDRAQYADAAALYKEAMLYDPLDPDLHLSLAGTLIAAGEVVEARSEIAEAKRLCELFEIQGCSGRAAETEGRLHWALGEHTRSAASYGRAVEAFTTEGLTTRALLPMKSQADVELRLWQLAAGVERLSRVVAQARQEGYDSLLIRALSSLGAGQFRMRDLSAASGALHEAVRLSVLLDHRAWEHSSQLNLANVLLLMGDVDGAASAVDRSLEIARGMEDGGNREASSLLRQADVQSKRGDDDAARTTLDLIIASDLRGRAGSQFRCSAQQRRIWIELDADDPIAALVAADAAVKESEALEIDATSGYSLCLRAVVRSRLSQTALAGEDLEAAGRYLANLKQAPALVDGLALGNAWLAASREDWNAVLGQAISGRPTTEGARLSLLQSRAEIELGRRDDATSRLRALAEQSHAPTSVADRARMAIPVQE